MKVILDTGINNNNQNQNFIEKENLQNNLPNLQNEKYSIDQSFGDFSLSDIGNKEKNYIPISKRTSNKVIDNEENYFLNDIEKIEKRGSLGSLKFEDFNNLLIFTKNKKIKLTKEDLNNIPLPIFSCIYCSNEKLSFNHFLNEILSNKYLLLTSIYDIKELNKILSYKYLIDKDEKNDKLEDIIIKNTEFLKKYYKYDELKKVLNLRGEDKKYFEIYQKKYILHIRSLLNNIKLKRIKKNLINKPSITKKLNQYYSFNYNNINNFNNISINNSIDGNGELNNNYKKINQNNINQTISNLSASNFNSVSLINYIDNNYQKEKENRFKLDDIIEQIEKNSNIEYFDFEKSRKIKKEDIEWENDYYDIWHPIIESEIGPNITSTTKKNTNANKINNTFVKKQKRNNSFYKKIKDNTSSMKKLSKGKGIQKVKDNLTSNKSYQKINEFKNKSYQKINEFKNKSKEISPENNKNLKKQTINNLIRYSSSKNNNKKNILINLKLNTKSSKLQKNTPTKLKTKIKMYAFNQKYISHKNLPISTNISLNVNKKLNMIPINLFNSSKKIGKIRNKQLKDQIPLNISIENKSTIYKKKAKSKLNFRITDNKYNKKEQLNRNKKNCINVISQNSSISTKKKIKIIEINTSPTYINKTKLKNKINLKSKITRNSTYQNLEKIKEKTFLINIYNSIYEPQYKLSNKKIKVESNKNFNSKLNENNLKNNQNKKDKHNNIHIKNKNGICKTKLNNDIDNKKNIYDIKILTKKNIEIKNKNCNKKIIY